MIGHVHPCFEPWTGRFSHNTHQIWITLKCFALGVICGDVLIKSDLIYVSFPCRLELSVIFSEPTEINSSLKSLFTWFNCKYHAIQVHMQGFKKNPGRLWLVYIVTGEFVREEAAKCSFTQKLWWKKVVKKLSNGLFFDKAKSSFWLWRKVRVFDDLEKPPRPKFVKKLSNLMAFRQFLDDVVCQGRQKPVHLTTFRWL